MKEESKPRIARNAGKVQFLARKEVIRDMLSQGYNYRNIHERLVKEHQATMSYHTFCFWMRYFMAQAGKTVEKNTTTLALSTTGTTAGKFMRPEDVSKEGLF